MSKFFRSSSSSTSSSDDDDSLDDGRGTGENTQMGAETDDSAEAVTTSLSNLQLGSVDNGVHSQMLLHALLEERCINEALQEHRTQYDARTRRDDPTGLDRDGLASARQRYRDGLDLLSQGTTPSAGQQMSISALLGRLLTQNEALPVMEDGQALNLDVGNEPRSQPSHSNHISSTEARGEQPSLQLARLRSDTSSVIDTLVPTHPMLEPSRYLRDFDELAVLGKGGYGIVYHVRNRLDGLQYAVKKVPISPARVARIQKRGQAELDELLLELRTLARLDHPNIVRYFAGWIEWTDVKSLHPKGLESGLSSYSGGFAHSTLSEDAVPGATDSRSRQRVATQSDTGPVDVVFENSEPTAEVSAAATLTASPPNRRSWSVSASDVSRTTPMSARGLAGSFLQPVPSTSASNRLSEQTCPDPDDTSSFVRSSTGPTLALHLQMGLYPMTLADLLSPKDASDTAVTPLSHCFHLQPSINILLALIDGVEYLHNHGIAHRDLKPANVFIRANDREKSLCPECHVAGKAQPGTLEVRIGDFGLVATLAQPESTRAASTVRAQSNATETMARSSETSTDDSAPRHRLALASAGTAVPKYATATEAAVKAPGVANGSVAVVGTEIYRPTRVPEHQQDLDVYALGIIAFELLYQFDTRMERHEAIHTQKHHGKFPGDFMKRSVLPKGDIAIPHSHHMAEMPIDHPRPARIFASPSPPHLGPEVGTATPRAHCPAETDSVQGMRDCIRKMLAHDEQVTLSSLRGDLLHDVEMT